MFRLEADTGDAAASVLTVRDAPLAEREILLRFFAAARQREWTRVDPRKFTKVEWDVAVPLKASLADASKILLRVVKPKKPTLVSVVFADNRLCVTEGTSETAVGMLETEIAVALKK